MAPRIYELRPPIVGPCVSDAIAAAACAGIALASGPNAVGVATALIAGGFAVSCTRRLRAPHRQLVLDGDRVAWAGTWYAGPVVALGPIAWLRGGRRAFRLYLLSADGPRFAVIAETEVEGFADLYASLRGMENRSLRVFHADHAVSRDLIGVAMLAMLFFAVVGGLQSHVGDTEHDRAEGTLLGAIAGAAVVVLLGLWSWRPRAPLLVVDQVGRRVYFKGWWPADQVRVGPLTPAVPPPGSRIRRFELETATRTSITHLAFGDVVPIHQALSQLPGVRR